MNLRVLAVVGLTAGVVQVLAGIAMYLAGVYFASWSTLVSMVVLLLCIVAGTKWYAARCHSGGITYTQALIAGVVMSVATGVVYAVYNMVSITYFYPNFLDQMLAAAGSRQSHPSFEVQRAGLSASGIAIPNLIRLSVIGTVLSALGALFLRKRSG